MKQAIFAAFAAVAMLSNTAGALAQPVRVDVVVPSGKVVSIPETAFEVLPGVFSLGQATDPATGEVVEGYAIVHYKQNSAKGGGNKPVAGTACYGFLGQNAKWLSAEPWLVNAANSEGLSDSFVFATLADDIALWEDATDGTLGNAAGVNVMTDGTLTTSALTADTTAPDNQNEVIFGSITESNAIAVTIVWGVFSGPKNAQKLLEWDMIFDEVDYDWSASGEADKMDFDNIATHELGHAFGLADLYSVSCSAETMFGYAGNGETNKRDLNAGDIAGINKLY